MAGWMNKLAGKCLLALAAVSVYTVSAAERQPYALMIMLDGFRADMLRVADMPKLRGIMSGNWHPGYRCAYSLAGQNIDDAKTYSYANHASIICGVTRAKHGVVFNCDFPQGNYKQWPSWQTLIVRARPGVKALFCSDGEPAIAKDEATIEWGTGAARQLAERLKRSDAPQVSALFLGIVAKLGMEFLSDVSGIGVSPS